MKKKKIIVWLLVASFVFSLCACGNKDSEENVTEISGDEVTNAVEETSEIENEEDVVNVLVAKSEDAYQEFITNNRTARFDESWIFFDGEEDYYLYDFLRLCDNWTKECSQEKLTEHQISYSYIDLGNDGVMELALQITNSTQNMGQERYLMLIKLVDDELKVLSMANGVYRSWCDLYTNGVMYFGGSNGAASHTSEYTYVSPDGKSSFTYTDTTDLYVEAAIVPYYYLNSYPEDYPMYLDEYYSDEEINMDIFSMSSDNFNTLFFSFTDENGNDVEVEEEYKSLYEKNGIKICKSEDIWSLIDSDIEAIGCKREQENDDSISDWIELDIENYTDIYGTNWVDSYKTYISDPLHFRDLLTEPYEMNYGYDPVAISGFSLADIDSDSIPELIILLKNEGFSVGEALKIFSFDEETYKLDDYGVVTSVGSEPGTYVGKYSSMPSDSFSAKYVNDMYCLPGVYDGKLYVFENFGDGFLSFDLAYYDTDNKSLEYVYNEYVFYDDASSYGSSGDADEALNIVSNLKYLYFVDFTDYNINAYVCENYLETDLFSHSGKETYDMLSEYIAEFEEKKDIVTWTDGPVNDADYLGYNYQQLIQKYRSN